eukprot:1511430-Amphidinium_carterae.1
MHGLKPGYHECTVAYVFVAICFGGVGSLMFSSSITADAQLVFLWGRPPPTGARTDMLECKVLVGYWDRLCQWKVVVAEVASPHDYSGYVYTDPQGYGGVWAEDWALFPTKFHLSPTKRERVKIRWEHRTRRQDHAAFPCSVCSGHRMLRDKPNFDVLNFLHLPWG